MNETETETSGTKKKKHAQAKGSTVGTLQVAAFHVPCTQCETTDMNRKKNSF